MSRADSREQRSSSRGRKKIVINNQKKSRKPSSTSYSGERSSSSEKNEHQRTRYSEIIFKTSFLEQFILKGSDEYTFKCKYCKDPLDARKLLELYVDSVYSHIRSRKHKSNTPENEKDLLNELI